MSRTATSPAGRNGKALIRHRPLTLALSTTLAAAGLVAIAVPGASAVDTVPITCATGGGGVATCEYADPTQVGEFKVPQRVTKLRVTLRGGEGGDGSSEAGGGPEGQGGAGGLTIHTVTVSPGQILHALIGEGGVDLGLGACLSEGFGGASGGYDGPNMSPAITGGDGGSPTGTWCVGGGGGAGTFLMRKDQLPTEYQPLAAAGGGGGGSGGMRNVATGGSDGGKGGAGAQDGAGPNPGEVGGGDQGGGDGGGAGGGGGGGGGYLGGGGGGAGSGGAGGCGVPETVSCEGSAYISSTTAPATYRAASLNGSLIIEYTVPAPTGGPGNGQPPPDVPIDPDPHGSGHPSSNDPNRNTNPKSDPKPLPGMDPNTDTALCKPEKKICTVSVSGPDSRFRIDAENGKQTAVLFATMNGNYRPASLEASGKPNCPNYAEQNSDWVQFGFTEPARGRTWHKTAYMTQRQKMKRAAATAMAQKLQICFAAPYKFPTRPGYRLGTQGSDWVGVLTECGSVRKAKGRPVPCVLTREIVKVKKGWTVRITFKIPANGKDPKALG